jgi:hypothetical protein
MRIPGTLLLISGILLCISVVWATVGFVTIAIGVIFVLIAERRDARRRSLRTCKPEAMQGARQERTFDLESDSAQAAEPIAVRSAEIQSAQQGRETVSRNNTQPAGSSVGDQFNLRENRLRPWQQNWKLFQRTASRVDQIEVWREPPPLPEQGGSPRSTAEHFKGDEPRESFPTAEDDRSSHDATVLGAKTGGYQGEASQPRAQEVFPTSGSTETVTRPLETERLPYLRAMAKSILPSTPTAPDEIRQVKLVLVPSEKQRDQLQGTVSPDTDKAEKWRAVVDTDVDVAAAMAAIEPFGKKYVDELARAYLVLDDKDYLPLILKKIAATIKKDTGRDFVIDLSAADLSSGAPGKMAPLKASPIPGLRAGGVDVISNRDLTDLPETAAETRQGLPVEGAVAQTPFGDADGKPGLGQAAVDSTPLLPGTAAGRLDEADLKDLLSRLNLQSDDGQRR